MRGRLTVLTFHRVLPDELCRDYLFDSLAVPASLFRAQAKVLAQRYHVVTLADGIAALDSRRGDDRPMIAMTFDDGYADNFSVAAPIMNAHGLPATFFVVAGLIGTAGELWYDVAARRWLAATPSALVDGVRSIGAPVSWTTDTKPSLSTWMAFLKRLPPDRRAEIIDTLSDPGRHATRQQYDRLMTPEELRSLRADGHEIGSHTLTHPLLPQLSDAMLQHELVTSRLLIEGWLNEPVLGFCYPNGDHDDRVVSATARAGYTYACLTRAGDNRRGLDRFRIRRVDMHPSRSCGLGNQFDESSFRASISRLHELHR